MRARMALGLIALTMLLSSCSNTGDQADILTPGLLPDGYTMEQAEGDERILLVRNALAVEDGDILSGHQILRQNPAWTEENYRKNGEEIALPDPLAAAAASLIEAEFERK